MDDRLHFFLEGILGDTLEGILEGIPGDTLEGVLGHTRRSTQERATNFNEIIKSIVQNGIMDTQHIQLFF